MLLSALLRDVPGAQMTGPDVEIETIEYVSKKVRPGTLFFAVPSVGGGADTGGYPYIPAALKAGAAAVLAQQTVEIADLTTVVVPNVRRAMGAIATTFYGHPSREMKVFAVTGTDGKTTTTYLLEQILSYAGRCTGMIGTVETKIGDERVYNLERMTTPESVDVQRLLRRMADVGVTHVAMEASSHALALDRLRGCTFAGCALTNITGDHVEFHGSFDAYVEAKRSLFAELAPDAPAVLNRDDPHWERCADAVRGPVFTYARGSDISAGTGAIHGSNFIAHVRERSARTTTFELVKDGESLGLFSVPLPGEFNLSNATAAAILAFIGGVEWGQIAEGLVAAAGPPGRMEEVSSDREFRVIVDYAHTPHAFETVLSELRRETEGNLIAVFGATGNRDRAKRPVLAQTASRFADFFVITNEDPFGEDVDAIIEDVARGAPSDGEGSRFVVERDRGKAIRLALERARPGDTIVITGKGHERSIVADGRREQWNDADEVRAALAGLP